MIEFGYNLTSASGKTILVGVPNKNINIYSLPLHFEKILKGSHGGNAIPDIDIPRYINLIDNNLMSLNKIISHEFKLSDINLALKLFRKGEAKRIVINMKK